MFILHLVVTWSIPDQSGWEWGSSRADYEERDNLTIIETKIVRKLS